MKATRSQKLKTIFTAGLIAAVLDISGAIIVYVFMLKITTIQKILQSVASGIYGTDAFKGGWSTAMQGLFIHICITIIFAALYFIVYPFFNNIIKNTLIAGFLYGCIVWCIMNMLVLPYSNASVPVFKISYFFYGVSLVAFLVGIPISIVTYDHYSKKGKRKG